MKTPEQIRDMEFQKTAMGGYKQSDVEVFLEEMASQIELLMRQKAESERKLQELSKNASDGALTTAGIQNVLVSAQRVADQIVDEAKHQAEGVKAEAALAVTEAEVKAKEIKVKAEEDAALLFKTATEEASKIIEEANSKAEQILVAARESVDLEQKLYDRLKIEISDFRKKAAAQCAAVIELINQLPDDIDFNMERAKTVLSIDFTNPDELLQNAVNAKLEEQKIIAQAEIANEKRLDDEAQKEAQDREDAIRAAIKVAEQSQTAEETKPEPQKQDEEERPEAIPVAVEASKEPEVLEQTEDVQLEIEQTNENEGAEFIIGGQPEIQPKGRISFGIADDDDDDDEPRLFFKRKKK